MSTAKRDYGFPQNVAFEQRCYPFHSGEELAVKSSIKKVVDYILGVTPYPKFVKGKGTYLVSKIILYSDGKDIRDCFRKYKRIHPEPKNLVQGESNPEDRFIRILSVWTEAGAITVKEYKIYFSRILKERLKLKPKPM